MRNIAQTQTVKIYKLLRVEGQPWVASVDIHGKFIKAEGKTQAEALIALAQIWPEPTEQAPEPEQQSYISSDFAMLAAVPPQKRAALERMYATSHMAIPKED